MFVDKEKVSLKSGDGGNGIKYRLCQRLQKDLE